MRLVRLLKNKKAISPLVSILILVGIAITGSIMVYAMAHGMFGVLHARGEIAVETVDLVKDTDGNVVFTMTLKNSGNKPVAALDGTHPLSITKPGKTDIAYVDAGANLQPGQSVAMILASPADLTAADYIVGNSYIVTITARFSDGSLFTTTISVVCRAA